LPELAQENERIFNLGVKIFFVLFYFELGIKIINQNSIFQKNMIYFSWGASRSSWCWIFFGKLENRIDP
jgi:hypothetical protein